MSTSEDFIIFVYDQIQELGEIRYKKMFGEYMVYFKEKPLLLVCDNTVYVKQLECISEMMKDSGRGFPYKNAKEHYILDIENIDLVKNVLELLERHTEVPKKRLKKVKNSNDNK